LISPGLFLTRNVSEEINVFSSLTPRVIYCAVSWAR
jgi:hypothetical protein